MFIGGVLHKIAIIEDDDLLRDMYQYKFEQNSYWVETADNGHSGFRLIKDFQPDLLLIDITLPVLNGIQTLERLFNDKKWIKPKIVLFSNIDEEHALKKAGHLNFDRYILKAHHTPSQVLNIATEMLA